LALSYPPKSVYPNDIDSNFTLYKVYNTAETTLSQDLDPYITTIHITPVDEGKLEIWADNGFVNINGELIYYNSVAKEPTTNKIITLLNCIRNLGGNKPEYCPEGTWVRGFVLAEHHNQLVRSVINTENFIGYEFNPDKETLDWRIRNIASVDPINDDHGCPEVDFWYYTVSQDNITGTTVNYNLNIIGSNYTFILNFGDGKSTTTEKTGTHVYPPNTNIDPIVTVTTNTCEQAVSGLIRNQGDQPVGAVADAAFEIIIPETPALPDLNTDVDNVVPDNILQPPIVFPCVDASFGPIVVPSIINIDPPINLPSTIKFGDVGPIPSSIEIGPIGNIPSTITISSATLEASLDLITANRCSICSASISVVNNKSVVYPSETTGTCCDQATGEKAKIINVTVIVHDMQIFGNQDYGNIKMLIESPSGKTCLLMGSGSGTNNVSDVVTLTFTDASTKSIYPKLDGSGIFKPSPNGNEKSRISGRANLVLPAPSAPYGTSLSTFNDDSVGTGKWKFYVVTGQASQTISIKKICVQITYGFSTTCIVPTTPTTPTTPTPTSPASPSPASPSPSGLTPAGPPQCAINILAMPGESVVYNKTQIITSGTGAIQQNPSSGTACSGLFSYPDQGLILGYSPTLNGTFSLTLTFFSPCSGIRLLVIGLSPSETITFAVNSPGISITNVYSCDGAVLNGTTISQSGNFNTGAMLVEINASKKYKTITITGPGNTITPNGTGLYICTDYVPIGSDNPPVILPCNLEGLDIYVRYSDTLGPCPGGHTCNAAIFNINANGEKIGVANLNNSGGPTDPGPNAEDKAAGRVGDRRGQASLTKEQIEAYLADNGGKIVIDLTCGLQNGGTCHVGIPWIQIIGKDTKTKYYDVCVVNQSFIIQQCEDQQPNPDPDSGCLLSIIGTNKYLQDFSGNNDVTITATGSVTFFKNKEVQIDPCGKPNIFARSQWLLLGEKGYFNVNLSMSTPDSYWPLDLMFIASPIDPNKIEITFQFYDGDNKPFESTRIAPRIGATWAGDLVSIINNPSSCTINDIFRNFTTSNFRSQSSKAEFIGKISFQREASPFNQSKISFVGLGMNESPDNQQSYKKYSRISISGNGISGPVYMSIGCNPVFINKNTPPNPAPVGFAFDKLEYNLLDQEQNPDFPSTVEAPKTQSGFAGYIAGGYSSSDSTVANSSISSASYKLIFATDTASAVTSANISSARYNLAGCSGNSIKGYFSGGYSTTALSLTDKITYSTEITIAATTASITASQNLAALTDGLNYGFTAGGQLQDFTVTNALQRISYSNDTVSALNGVVLHDAVMGLRSLSANFAQGYLSGGNQNSYFNTTNKFVYSTNTLNLFATAELAVGLMNMMGVDGDGNKGFYIYGLTNVESYGNANKIIFATDVASGLASANLTQPRNNGAGISERISKGYAAGGRVDTSFYSSILAVVDIFDYSTETASSVQATDLPINTSNCAAVSPYFRYFIGYGGYSAGGMSSQLVNLTEKLVYSANASSAMASANISNAKDYLIGCSGTCLGGYFTGGSTGTAVNNTDKIIYSAEIMMAMTSANLSVSRYAGACLSNNIDTGYFAGGYSNSDISSVERISYVTDVSSSATTAGLSQARHGLAGLSYFAVRGYLLGGMTGSSYVSTGEILNYATEITTANVPTNLTSNRAYCAAIDKSALNGFILGGDTGSTTYSKTTELVTFATNATSLLSATYLPTGKAFASAISQKITTGYLLGGSTGSANPTNTAERIQFETNSISEQSSSNMLVSRKNHASVSPYCVPEIYGRASYILSTNESLYNINIQKIMHGYDVSSFVSIVNFDNTDGLSTTEKSISAISGNEYGAYAQFAKIAYGQFQVNPLKFNYSTEVLFLATTAQLTIQKQYSAGLSSCINFGYFCAGSSPEGEGTYLKSIDAISYANDTAYAVTGSELSEGKLGLSGISLNSDAGYLAGGYNRAPMKSVEKFTFQSETVSQLSSVELSYGRYNAAGCDGNSIYGYFVGGRSDSSYISSTDAFSYPPELTFTNTTADISAGRENLAATSDRNAQGYISGGYNGSYSNLTEKIVFLSQTTNILHTADLVCNVTGSAGISQNTCNSSIVGTKGYIAGANNVANTGNLSCSVINFGYQTQTLATSLISMPFRKANVFHDNSALNIPNGISSGKNGVLQWFSCPVVVHDSQGSTLTSCVGAHVEYATIDYTTSVTKAQAAMDFALGGTVASLDGTPVKGYFTGGGMNDPLLGGPRVNMQTLRYNYITNYAEFAGSANLSTRCNGRAGISGDTTKGYITGGYNIVQSAPFDLYNGCSVPIFNNNTENIRYSTEVSSISPNAVLNEPKAFLQTAGMTDVKAYVTGGKQLSYGGFDSFNGACNPISVAVKNTEIFYFSTDTYLVKSSAYLDNSVCTSSLSDRYAYAYFMNGQISGSPSLTIKSIAYATDTSANVSVSISSFFNGLINPQAGLNEFPHNTLTSMSLPEISKSIPTGSISATTGSTGNKFVYATETWNMTNINSIFLVSSRSWSNSAAYNSRFNPAYLSGNSVRGYIESTKITYSTEVASKLASQITNLLYNIFGFSNGLTAGYFAESGGIYGSDLSQSFISMTSGPMSKVLYTTDVPSSLATTLPISNNAYLSGFSALSDSDTKAIIVGASPATSTTSIPVIIFSYSTETNSANAITGSEFWADFSNGFKGRPLTTQFDGTTAGYIKAYNNTSVDNSTFNTNKFIISSITKIDYSTNVYSLLNYTSPDVTDAGGDFEQRGSNGYGACSPISVKCIVDGKTTYCQKPSTVVFKFNYSTEVFSALMPNVVLNPVQYDPEPTGSAYCGLSPYAGLAFAFTEYQAFKGFVSQDNFYIITLKNGKNVIVSLENKPEDNFVAGPFSTYTEASLWNSMNANPVEATFGINYAVNQGYGTNTPSRSKIVHSSLPKLEQQYVYGSPEPKLKTTHSRALGLPKLENAGMASTEVTNDVIDISVAKELKSNLPKLENNTKVVKIIPNDSSIKIDTNELLGENDA